MKNIIIGIHGLANKPEREILQTWWADSLAEGLRHNCGNTHADYFFDLCYWAGYLYKNHLHTDENFTFDDHYNKEPWYAADPNNLKTKEDGWWDSARATLSSIIDSSTSKVSGSVFEGLTDTIMLKKLRDLRFYWNEERHLLGDDDQTKPAKEVLQSSLMKLLKTHAGEDTKIMLIAHSMGSIIAYDVLRRLGREENNQVWIDHFVTIGSPLGLPIVKSRVETVSWDNKVRTPTIVKGAWVNYSDQRDKVAIDTHLGNDYEANKSFGVRVRDDIVCNDYHSPLKDEANPHKSYGYLRTPELSRLVAKFLESS